MTLKSFLNARKNVFLKEIFDVNDVFKKNFVRDFNSKNPYLIFTGLLFFIQPIPRLIYRSIYRKKLSNKRIRDVKTKFNDEKIGLISITFAGRSGSILLSNILDGHSQIISLPPVYSFFEGPLEIIKLMQRIEFSSLKVFKRFKFYRLWWQKLLISFISETYKDLFSFDTVESKETGKFGLIETSVQTDQKSLNNSHKLELFKANISKLIFELKKVPSPKDLILIIHYAYYQTCGIKFDKEKIKYIAWQRHRLTDNFDVYLLKRNFKELIFITPIRHPVVAIDSHVLDHKSHKFKGVIPSNFNQEKYLNNHIREFLISVNHSYPKEVGKQIFYRFEDLHQNPRELLNLLAELLEIKLENSLYETTLNGKQFFFLSGKNLITGFNNNIFEKKIKFKTLLKNELLEIEKRCEHIVKEFNYKEIYKSQSKQYNPTKNKHQKNNLKVIYKNNKKRILIVGNRSYPDKEFI